MTLIVFADAHWHFVCFVYLGIEQFGAFILLDLQNKTFGDAMSGSREQQLTFFSVFFFDIS